MSNLENSSRRSFVKKSAYIAPAVLTLKAAPSFATIGSSRHDDNGGHNGGGNNNQGNPYGGGKKKRKTW